jgi:proline iminopeptidase
MRRAGAAVAAKIKPMREWMAGQIPNGSYLYCPKGSHMAFHDDQVTYFKGLIEFLKKVDSAG